MMSRVPLWVLIFLLAACSENPPESKEGDTSATVISTDGNREEGGKPTASVTDPTPIPDDDLPTPVSAWSYHHLRGKIKDLAITMELCRLPAAYEADGYRYQGYYRYDRVGGPIAVYGSVDSAGWLVLYETAQWQGGQPFFRGEWSADEWRGKWTSGDGQRTYNFVLTKTESDGSLAFVTRSIMDTFLLKPQWSTSPQATYQIDWVEPQADSNALNRFLQREILRGLVGDSLANRHGSLEGALVADKRAYFQEYRDEMIRLIKEGLIDTVDMDLFHSFSYEQTSAVFIYCNSPEILTLGYQYYYFTGGAHGNYATSIVTYDLPARRVITLNEVLAPGFEPILSVALEQAVRRKYGLTEQAPLSEVLFDDVIAPNENFGLTEKGIFFVYPPYEIAPYAAGEIELYVPFTDIAQVVQPRWLERS